MQTILQTTLSLLMGAVITINGVAANTDEIVAEATKAVNTANIHQIATVLEIYYMNNGEYPDVSGGEALINTFEEEGYILNRPLDPDVFEYRATDNAQNYTLKLK